MPGLCNMYLTLKIKLSLKEGRAHMITYEPFFETLKHKRITTYKLINEFGFSKGTLDSLKQNKNVTMETLNYICNLLECEVDDVIKYTRD